jgi:hypothetical protein
VRVSTVAVEKQYGVRVCILALDIRHATRMRGIVLCGLSGCTMLFYVILQNGKTFGNNLLDQNVCFDFLYTHYMEKSLL